MRSDGSPLKCSGEIYFILPIPSPGLQCSSGKMVCKDLKYHTHTHIRSHVASHTRSVRVILGCAPWRQSPGGRLCTNSGVQLQNHSSEGGMGAGRREGTWECVTMSLCWPWLCTKPSLWAVCREACGKTASRTTQGRRE